MGGIKIVELRKPFFRVLFQSSLTEINYDYDLFIEAWKKAKSLRIKCKVMSACDMSDGDMFWYEEQGFNLYKKFNGEEITIYIMKMVKCGYYCEHLASDVCCQCEINTEQS
jgi:hypothetical protein